MYSSDSSFLGPTGPGGREGNSKETSLFQLSVYILLYYDPVTIDELLKYLNKFCMLE